MGKRQGLLTGLAVLLLMVSGVAWFSYVAQAIGYSAMPPSVQQQNSSLKVRALLAFGIALGLEGLAVAIIAWQRVLTANGAWLRLGAAMGIGFVADFFTYVLIRAIF